MFKKLIFTFGLAFVGLALLPQAAHAALTYPIRELGHCRDAKECYLYCQIPTNKAACWSYGKYVLYPSVLGENTDQTAAGLGITFPIAQLGNCSSTAECKSYCSTPANYQACSEFAQTKGIKRPDQSKQRLVELAAQELGCTTHEACKTYCDQYPSACAQFAKKHNLNQDQERSSSEKQQFIQQAQQELGCDSAEACKAFCESNRERCSQFSRKFGSYHRRSENDGRANLPCGDDQSCRQYCLDHPSECQQRADGQKPNASESGLLGPTGCRTESECRTWCAQNPDKCPGYKQSTDYLQDTRPVPPPASGSGTRPAYQPPIRNLPQ